MSNKTAQHTELDKSLLEHEPSARYWRAQERQVLPFEDWKLREELKESVEKQRGKGKAPTEPLKLKYPELTPEMIKYRGLTEKELQRLRESDEEDYRRHQESYWKRDQPFTPPHERYYELHKSLPEDAKKRVLDKYNQLRQAAAEFQTKYNEANELASREVELDYSGSYIDLFRNFGRFIVANIHKQLGVLFGILPEGGRRSYSYSSRALHLSEFINKGINLFNITPLNIDTKIHEMNSAIHAMRAIIDEYERRKKVLKKLPQVDADVKRFLLKRDNRAFLKWMDEYFPNDKKDFMEGAIRNIMDTYPSDSGVEFKLGQLKKIKTYSDAYWKSKQTATNELLYKMERQVQGEVQSRLQAELMERIRPKVLEFVDIGLNAVPDNMDELIKYVYRNYKFDLRSVFNFVHMSMQRYYSDRGGGEKDETGLTLTEEKFLEFKKNFLDDLKSRLQKLQKEISEGTDQHDLGGAVERIVRDYIGKYFNRGKRIEHKELSELSSKDFDELMNSYFRNLIISRLPNFEKSGWRYEYALPGFEGAGKLLQETGKFSVESIVNYAHKLVPFVPKEFIVHLVKSLFKGQIPESDTITSLDAGYASIRNLAGTTPATAMKVFLHILKKSGKFSPDNFTNQFIKHFETIYRMVSKFITEFNSTVVRKDAKSKFPSDEEIIKLFDLIIRNFETVPRDDSNFNSIMSFMHNSAGNLDKKDIVKLFSNKNFVSYSKVGIVRKVFNSYAMIKNIGGIKGIYEKYGNTIESLKTDGFISKNFDANINFIVRVFNSGEEINPAKPFFKRLFAATSAMETDLETIEMGDSLRDMLRNYQTKDKRLFNLDLQINDRLRFRVLKDRDPRMLRVGIESNCCQRIGGVGEAAARDSFMNPLAGVVILEWKNDEGQWVLLTQSYFHYVPTKNAYILDNVEANGSNVNDSGVDLSAMYAYLAKVIKEKYDVGYFLAGKSFSKINTKDFRTNRLRGGDPRSFNRDATTGHGGVYSDFSPSDNIDLTTPKFDLDKRISKYLQEGQEIKKAFEVGLSRLIKFALVA